MPDGKRQGGRRPRDSHAAGKPRVPPDAYLADLGDERDPTDDALDPLESDYTGDPTPPEPNERGRKDMVQVHPGTITRIKTRFGSHTGRCVWHCHILEHEDYDVVTEPK